MWLIQHCQPYCMYGGCCESCDSCSTAPATWPCTTTAVLRCIAILFMQAHNANFSSYEIQDRKPHLINHTHLSLHLHSFFPSQWGFFALQIVILAITTYIPRRTRWERREKGTRGTRTHVVSGFSCPNHWAGATRPHRHRASQFYNIYPSFYIFFKAVFWVGGSKGFAVLYWP